MRHWILVVVLLAGCTADANPEPELAPRPALVPPIGMRWQGLNETMVAVPDSWETSTDPCRWPEVDTVRLLTIAAAAMRCPYVGRRSRSASVLTLLATADGLQVSYQGPRRPGFLTLVRGTTRAVPDGWTTVPTIRYGVSDEPALARIEKAGLDGSVPDVDWPHYVTGTDPPAGTAVPLGSEVRLEIGDG